MYAKEKAAWLRLLTHKYTNPDNKYSLKTRKGNIQTTWSIPIAWGTVQAFVRQENREVPSNGISSGYMAYQLWENGLWTAVLFFHAKAVLLTLFIAAFPSRFPSGSENNSHIQWRHRSGLTPDSLFSIHRMHLNAITIAHIQFGYILHNTEMWRNYGDYGTNLYPTP